MYLQKARRSALCQVNDCAEEASWLYCEEHDAARLVDTKADAAKCVEILAASQPEPSSEPEAPREIKVGSKWRHKRSGRVREVTESWPLVVWLSTGNDWHIDEFRAGNEWVSDPPASETTEGDTSAPQ